MKFLPWGSPSVLNLGGVNGFLVSLRQSLPGLPDPGTDSVGIDAVLLGQVNGGDAIVHALVYNLSPLLEGQVLSVVSLVPDKMVVGKRTQMVG